MGVNYSLNNDITVENIRENNIVGFDVRKEEVLKLDITRLGNAFNVFEKAKKDGKQKLLLTFNGWGHIPDEIFEIKEIRTFVMKLFEKYPHMFYFLTPVYNNNQIILACISDITAYKFGDKKSATDLFFEQSVAGRLGLKINIPTNIQVKIISKLREYGQNIKEDKKEIQRIIDNVVYNKESGAEHINELLNNIDPLDISLAYNEMNINLWIGFNKSIGIKTIIQDEDVQNFIDSQNHYLNLCFQHNMVSAPIMVGSDNSTNLFFVQDKMYGEVCSKCGSNYFIIVKKDLSFDEKTLQEKVIFLPSAEYFISKKIAPHDQQYINNLPVPINPEKDLWYCIKCKTFHKFKYDSDIGLQY